MDTHRDHSTRSALPVLSFPSAPFSLKDGQDMSPISSTASTKRKGLERPSSEADKSKNSWTSHASFELSSRIVRPEASKLHETWTHCIGLPTPSTSRSSSHVSYPTQSSSLTDFSDSEVEPSFPSRPNVVDLNDDAIPMMVWQKANHFDESEGPFWKRSRQDQGRGAAGTSNTSSTFDRLEQVHLKQRLERAQSREIEYKKKYEALVIEKEEVQGRLKAEEDKVKALEEELKHRSHAEQGHQQCSAPTTELWNVNSPRARSSSNRSDDNSVNVVSTQLELLSCGLQFQECQVNLTNQSSLVASLRADLDSERTIRISLEKDLAAEKGLTASQAGTMAKQQLEIQGLSASVSPSPIPIEKLRQFFHMGLNSLAWIGDQESMVSIPSSSLWAIRDALYDLRWPGYGISPQVSSGQPFEAFDPNVQT